MSKVNILNLILFIAVILLGFIIYNSEQQSTLLERISTIDTNTIQHIQINHNKRTITAHKNNRQWEITQPISINANNTRIESLLKLLNAPIHAQFPSDKLKQYQFNLDTSTTRVTFDNNTFIFGETNPATGLRYILSDNIIYTIEDVYYPLISSSIGTLISLNLLEHNSSIEKLILNNQTILKNDKGSWQSTASISTDIINKTIHHWKTLRAFVVHQYSPRDDLGNVIIHLADSNKPIKFIITETDPSLILARPDLNIEYHFDISAFNNLIDPIN